MVDNTGNPCVGGVIDQNIQINCGKFSIRFWGKWSFRIYHASKSLAEENCKYCFVALKICIKRGEE